ncbi:MAG: hypothetical protein R3Y54_07940 [Eubacteriales bacterium]
MKKMRNNFNDYPCSHPATTCSFYLVPTTTPRSSVEWISFACRFQ